jgi:hypothetical protein
MSPPSARLRRLLDPNTTVVAQAVACATGSGRRVPAGRYVCRDDLVDRSSTHVLRNTELDPQ